MKTVLVIGSGAREHALAWRLAVGAGSVPLADRRVLVCPGNAGIARELSCLPVPMGGVDGFVQVALEHGADLVVVGPEQPLVDGLVDALHSAGVAVLGPSAEAARLEGEKRFMKEILDEAGARTARWGSFTDAAEADAFLATFEDGVVVKADGLCAGKGVVVCEHGEQARAVVREFLGGGSAAPRFGAASARVLLEERLEGRELSVIALCDGERAVPFAPARDHKRLLDEDRGPNTGGMGAVAPLGADEGVSEALLAQIDAEVFGPVLARMRERGAPYRGFLYAGLMLTAAGPSVLEFNVRFGDPEAQAVLFGTELDLLPLFEQVAAGGALPADLDLRSACRPAATVVCAAAGYPDAPRRGDVIDGLDAAGAVAGAKVFFAGVGVRGEELVSAGGRVLGPTATGKDLEEALERAYQAAAQARFDGMQLRWDIGRSAL
jgi:phosphoribosylamine---glycine ligase